MNGHIASACLRAVVKCSVPVCQEKMRRQELVRHLARDATTHVDLLTAERSTNNFDNVSYKVLERIYRDLHYNYNYYEKL